MVTFQNMMKWITLLFLLLVVEIASAENARITPTNTIIVNSPTDNYAPGDGQCSLREAIFNANNNDQSGSADCAAGDGEDIIQFNFGGTPTTMVMAGVLGSIDITSHIWIDASGETVTLSAEQLTSSLFVLENCICSLTLRRFAIANAAVDDNGNGGVLRLHPYTTAHFDEMHLHDNHAGDGGVAFVELATLIIERSTFERNAATEGWGGVVFAFGNSELIIRRSSFLNNWADTFGGAIYISSSRLELYNSVFEHNRTESTGQDGGAIRIHESFDPCTASTYIEDTTFAHNVADRRGGAISNAGSIEIVNSTFYANQAGGYGGAMYSFSADCTPNRPTKISYSTFHGNSSEALLGHAVYFSESGNRDGIVMNANIMTKRHDVVSLTGPSCYAADGASINPISSLGGNVVNGCSDQLTHTSDQQTATLALGALIDNGGTPAPTAPPKTLAIPNTSSLAYNAKNFCDIGDDQRGESRSVRRCDAGAYELEGVPTMVEISQQSTGNGRQWSVGFFVVLLMLTLCARMSGLHNRA